MTDYPTLGRIPYFDERSRAFSIRNTLDAPLALRKRTWTTLPIPLDQGREGRCVIFGWGAELAATPHRYQINNLWCNTKWPLVQAEDRKMGNNWVDGASVLAGAKAVRNEGAISNYAWAFGIDDVLQTISRKGPVLLGINWYESMYETDGNGLVTISGRVVGGHCIMASGYHPRHPMFGECVEWTNSWGPTYGINGKGFIRIKDLSRLLREDGEACIPTDRPVKL